MLLFVWATDIPINDLWIHMDTNLPPQLFISYIEYDWGERHLANLQFSLTSMYQTVCLYRLLQVMGHPFTLQYWLHMWKRDTGSYWSLVGPHKSSFNLTLTYHPGLVPHIPWCTHTHTLYISPHAYIIITMVTINYNMKIRDIEHLVEDVGLPGLVKWSSLS